jgi:serralysin
LAFYRYRSFFGAPGLGALLVCLGATGALAHGPGQAEPLQAVPAPAINSTPSASGTVVPLSSVPQLSSHPQSTVKIYLDFTGAAAQSWGSYNVTTTPAYDTDNDPTTFSSNELSQIQEVWSRVAEKYSPFNVDVTTVDPGTYPYNKVVRVVIGGDGAWAGGVYGGYTYPGGFTGNTSNTSWIFPKNLGAGFPKYVAEASAHEAGHEFGLVHQSSYDAFGNKTDEYRGGRDKSNPNASDPIMGFSYYASRGLWATGPSSNGPSSTQDDLAIISSATNGFGYRPDDHGNTRALADQLTEPNGVDLSGSGVIEQNTDVDYFHFTSDGGTVSIRADVAPLGPMLDLALSLTDANGNVLSAADTASLGESVSAIVPAGDYYLAVSSHGGYGDIGQYTITGTAVPEPGVVSVVLLAAAGLRRRRR